MRRFLRVELLYWLIPIASIVMQFVMTQAGAGHIRPEELSESIRGPYWLAPREGISGTYPATSGGMPSLLFGISSFGFSLRGAADFRFVSAYRFRYMSWLSSYEISWQ